MRLIESVHNVKFKTLSDGEMFSVLVGRHESVGASEHHTVAIVKLPIGGKSEEHFHKEREESYFIIFGKGEVFIDGKSSKIKSGTLIHTKPNERHRFNNTGESELSYLVITAPRWVPDDSHSK